MALYPLQSGMNPLGQMDVLNTEAASLKGGEVMTLGTASRANSESETAAQDALDGYTYVTPELRPVAKTASDATEFPLYLADEGTSPDYLTYYGKLMGPVGLGEGAALGPHTAAASGKVTLWDKPGLYAVTLDACASDFVSSIAAGLTPGASIGFTADGKLAHGACAAAVAATGVAHFVEFSAEPGLVKTPARLVGAAETFTRVVLQFHAGHGVRTL